MRFFIGHRLIGGFYGGVSFRPHLHPEIQTHKFSQGDAIAGVVVLFVLADVTFHVLSLLR